MGAPAAIVLILICVMSGSNLFFLTDLRENALQHAEEDLSRHSLTLAENADRSVKSVDLVLTSVRDYLARGGAIDAAAYRKAAIEKDSEKATVEWTVTDSGIGIAADKIGSLFANFVQADNSINRRFGGSGLRLAICKRLTEQMGGEINVTSTLGSGSSFSFRLTLPIAETVAVPEQSDDGIYASLQNRITAFGRPLRVLVVDDNPTNRLVATKMLKDFDIQTDAACDGAEAVTAASRFNYDLILMDVRMPEMDGFQATRIIRARGERRSNVPIIAFTANAFMEDIRAGREAGMNDFVVKPARKKALVQAILRVLPAATTVMDMVAPDVAPLVPAEQDAGPAEMSVDTEVAPEPALDREAYAELVGEIGDDAAQEIRDVFFSETDARLKLLRKLVLKDERIKIGREAHSLKSAAGTFRYRRLASYARALEKSAPRLSANEYAELLDNIDAAYAAARTHEPPMPPGISATPASSL